MSQSTAVLSVDISSDQWLNGICHERLKLAGGFAEFGISSRSTTEEQLEGIMIVIDPLEVCQKSEFNSSATVCLGDARSSDDMQKALTGFFDEGQIQLTF